MSAVILFLPTVSAARRVALAAAVRDPASDARATMIAILQAPPFSASLALAGFWTDAMLVNPWIRAGVII